MNPYLAALIYACGIAGLFYLDRDRKSVTSRALWLPIIYFWIIGSRSISQWFGISGSSENVQIEGSPLDAAVFGILLVGAIAVLIRRKRRVATLLTANWPILLYFLYCLISVCWSFHPDVSLKRWIKATGDLALPLVVVTDPHPVEALKRLFSRTGFLMLPTSLLFIKYFPQMGRGFSPAGEPMNLGITTNKNTLGVVLLVIALGTLWNTITLLRDKKRPDRRRHLIAQGVLLLFGVSLLGIAHSATSASCFVLGAGLSIATNLRAVRSRPNRIQVICLLLAVAGLGTFLFSGSANVAGALGRSSTLSGRTEIWAALIPTVPNSLVGAGYEGYWISPAPEQLWEQLAHSGWWHPEVLVTEAHNGYIEVFLNLGWLGVGLIALILITGYRRAIAAVRVNPPIGGLMLGYVMASAVYSITEAGFRSLDPIWMFLLLAITCSTAITAGYFGERVKLGGVNPLQPQGGSLEAPRGGVKSGSRQTWEPPEVPVRKVRKWADRTSSATRTDTSY
jgi:O-antigen ligase